MTAQPEPPAAGSITWIGHSTALIETAGLRFLTDPMLRDRVLHLRRHGPPVDPDRLRDLDAILISHLHYDHLDRRSLRSLESSAPVIAPAGAKRLLRGMGREAVIELAAGEHARVGTATVLAVPAAHHGIRRPLGARTKTLGYVIAAETSVYFAGDTDIFDGMREIGDRGLDAALLPVSGWGARLDEGHLDAERAAEALRLLRPRVAIPIHWGTFFRAGPSRIRHHVLSRPPREFAEHAARVAPDVTVKVLEPGESLELGAVP